MPLPHTDLRADACRYGFRPLPSSAEDQIDLVIMRDLIREAMGLPADASTREITVSARTFILMNRRPGEAA